MSDRACPSFFRGRWGRLDCNGGRSAGLRGDEQRSGGKQTGQSSNRCDSDRAAPPIIATAGHDLGDAAELRHGRSDASVQTQLKPLISVQQLDDPTLAPLKPLDTAPVDQTLSWRQSLFS